MARGSAGTGVAPLTPGIPAPAPAGMPPALAARSRRVLDRLSCWWTPAAELDLTWLTSLELDAILHGLEHSGLIEVHARDRVSWARSPARCRVRPTAGARPAPPMEPLRLPER